MSLLDSVEPNEVLAILDTALTWLETSKDLYSKEIFNALKYRISHRKALLFDLSRETEEWHTGATPEWDTSLELLARVEETHKLGKPVAEAFSTSVQRKLASQVPPRPIVEISFEDAISSLKKLCVEGKDMLKIIKYQGSTNLVVSKKICRLVKYPNLSSLELFLELHGSTAITLAIHPFPFTVFVFQGDEDLGIYVSQASFV